VAGISDDGSDVRERKTQATEQPRPGFAIRDIRSLDAACERQSKRVHKDVPLVQLYALYARQTCAFRRARRSSPIVHP
jgi:hypothetical protein